MRYFLTLIFLMPAFSSQAQTLEIGYAPVSVKAGWGKLPKTYKFNATLLFTATRYRSFRYTPGLRYAHVRSTSLTATDEFGDPVKGEFNMLFLMPAAFDLSFNRISLLSRFGFGWSDETFPNKNGLRSNFVLEAGAMYFIRPEISFSVRYSHISNGYRGPTNPGVDNIVLAIGIHL